MDEISNVTRLYANLEALVLKNPLFELFEFLTQDPFLRFGNDGPGRDGIDADAVWAEFPGERLRQAQHRAFGGDIGDVTIKAPVECHRAKIHDRALAFCLHSGRACLREREAGG